MNVQLKELREQRGIPVKIMCMLIDVKESTYRKWETRRNTMSLDMACRCADILGCTLDELAGRTPSPFSRLTNEELQLLAYYRHINDESQVDVMLRAMDAYESDQKVDSESN